MKRKPVQAGPTGTEAAVCRDIAMRQAFGIKKYGTTVAENPLELKAWLEHAYEECLDQAVYLKRAMAELDKTIYGKQADSEHHVPGVETDRDRLWN